MKSTVLCPRCQKTMSFEAWYCSDCGKSLKAAKGQDKRYKNSLQALGVSEYADVRPLVDFIYAGIEPQEDFKYPSVADVIEMLNTTCNERQRQVLIRRFGLDGLPARSIKQIAAEAGVSTGGIYSKIDYLRRRLLRYMVAKKNTPASRQGSDGEPLIFGVKKSEFARAFQSLSSNKG